MNVFLGRKHIIKLSGALLENEELIRALSSVYGINIVHGAGEQISSILDAEAIDYSFDADGSRVTSPEAMRYVEKEITRLNSELFAALNRQGGLFKFCPSVVLGRRRSKDNLTGVLEKVLVPRNYGWVLGSLGYDVKEGCYINLDADEVAVGLARESGDSLVFITESANGKGYGAKVRIEQELEDEGIAVGIMTSEEFISEYANSNPYKTFPFNR